MYTVSLLGWQVSCHDNYWSMHQQIEIMEGEIWLISLMSVAFCGLVKWDKKHFLSVQSMSVFQLYHLWMILTEKMRERKGYFPLFRATSTIPFVNRHRKHVFLSGIIISMACAAVQTQTMMEKNRLLLPFRQEADLPDSRSQCERLCWRSICSCRCEIAAASSAVFGVIECARAPWI